MIIIVPNIFLNFDSTKNLLLVLIKYSTNKLKLAIYWHALFFASRIREQKDMHLWTAII